MNLNAVEWYFIRLLGAFLRSGKALQYKASWWARFILVLVFLDSSVVMGWRRGPVPSIGSIRLKMTNSSFAALYVSNSALNVSLAVLYSLIVFVGLVGNSLVIIIVCKSRSMFSTTNVLLANVAAADFISLVWCPIPLAVNLSGRRASGIVADYICKFFTGYAVTCVTVGVTYLSLVVLAMERYYAIIKPFNPAFVPTKQRMYFVIGGIWATAITCSLPGFILSEHDEKSGRCLDPWTLERARCQKSILVLNVIFSLFFSGCLCFCYFKILKGIYIDRTVCSVETAASRFSSMREKRKLAMISLTVTIAYYVCYLPFLTFEIYIAFESYRSVQENYEALYKIYRILGFIMYVNSCLNPFFYAFQSSNYRMNLKRIFTRTGNLTAESRTISRRT